MKKRAYIFWMILAVAAVTVTPALMNHFHTEQAGEPSYNFTFVCPLRWENVASGISNADYDVNTDTKLMGSGHLDTDAMAQTIRDSIRTKPDGLITAGMTDAGSLSDAIDQASQEGIPVVLVDSDLPETDRISYIGSDNSQLGMLCARLLYDSLENKEDTLEVCLVISNMDAVNQKERLEGFRKQIKEYSRISICGIIECDSEPLRFKEQYLDFTRLHPEMNAICCLEGRSAKEIGNILTGADSVPYVIGVDYNTTDGSSPQEDVYTGIVKQDQRRQGYLAVQTLTDYLDGKKVEDIQYTDLLVFTSDQLGEVAEADMLQESEGDSYEWHLY